MTSWSWPFHLCFATPSLLLSPFPCRSCPGNTNLSTSGLTRIVILLDTATTPGSLFPSRKWNILLNFPFINSKCPQMNQIALFLFIFISSSSFAREGGWLSDRSDQRLLQNPTLHLLVLPQETKPIRNFFSLIPLPFLLCWRRLLWTFLKFKNRCHCHTNFHPSYCLLFWIKHKTVFLSPRLWCALPILPQVNYFHERMKIFFFRVNVLQNSWTVFLFFLILISDFWRTGLKSEKSQKAQGSGETQAGFQFFPKTFFPFLSHASRSIVAPLFLRQIWALHSHPLQLQTTTLDVDLLRVIEVFLPLFFKNNSSVVFRQAAIRNVNA